MNMIHLYELYKERAVEQAAKAEKASFTTLVLEMKIWF